MFPQENTKEKILALLTVILLFLFVGILFIGISINNKEKTAALKRQVLKIRADKEIAAKLNQTQLATSTVPQLTSKSFLTMVVTNNGTKKILAQCYRLLVLQN